MDSPERIGQIVAAVVRAVAIPVTIKIRSGPDAGQETAVEVAQRAEDAGAAAVSVHARSVQQAYVGGPDWSVLARVKQATCLPVIGGGGIREADDAVRMLAETGVDAVSIGRGCLGNPWIFRQARALLSGGGRVAAADPGGAWAADAAIDRRRVPSLRAAAGPAAFAAHERLLCAGAARRGSVSRRGPAGEESSPVPPRGAAVLRIRVVIGGNYGRSR